MILTSTAAFLLAADIPLPTEMTALGMVGTFLLWLIRRENRHEIRDDSITRGRLDDLEAEVEQLRLAEGEQRHLKHDLKNRLAGLRGTLLLIQRTAESCTCAAMAPVLPLLETILVEEGEST